MPDAAARTTWMREGKYGLMVHWLAPGPPREHGPYISSLDDAVEQFDAARFLAEFEASGADWLIFTIGQNSGCYASPSIYLDRRAGVGHTSKRDLVLELARAVKRMRKRFVAYLPAEVEGQADKIKAAFGWNPADQTEFQGRYTAFIREYALRYAANLDGWWFDGCYTWPVFPNSAYRWADWCAAARAGNPNAALAFNDGSFCVGITSPITPHQDYLSGEVELLRDGMIRLGREPDGALHLPLTSHVGGTGCQWHALVPIDAPWAHACPGQMEPPLYSDDELFAFVKRCHAVGGAVTLNAGIYQEGHLGTQSLAQLKRLSASFGP